MDPNYAKVIWMIPRWLLRMSPKKISMSLKRIIIYSEGEFRDYYFFPLYLYFSYSHTEFKEISSAEH